MPEKRRTRSTGGQAKSQRPSTQTTLKDLFRRTNSDSAPSVKEQDLHPEDADPVAPFQAANPCPPAQPSKPPKPSNLFPIFTKASSVRERPLDTVIDMDDTEVIDITDMSSDVESSTEPFTHKLSTHPESSQVTSHSPPHPPIGLVVHCSGNTNFPHAGTLGNTRPYKTSKKELHKRTSELGDVAPLPSSCAQHVRGVQHSYTCSQAPPKRSVFPSCSPSDEGTLDFLATWRRLGDTPSTSLDRIHRSLTPQQCEEHLHSLSRDCTESHPAFARISVQQERTSVHHAETWIRRFRPRRANEVLGNERHALYLRDWLRALGLHLQGCKPEEPVSKGATARGGKEKRTSKRAEPRGVKRPRVIRAVVKKRGNKKRRMDSDDDLDDFVVSSDADEEEADDPPEDSEDEFAFCQHTFARLRRRDINHTDDAHPDATNDLDTEIEHTTPQSQEPVQTNFTDNLTNTLLITGPPGCGKTAAVYACAEELGWEIFEVYPGIGRRSGTSLDHLVGDVGRNHIVQTVHRQAPRKTAKPEAKKRMELRGHLTKGKTGEFAGFGESQEAGSEREPISVEGNSPTHEAKPPLRDQEMDSSDEGVMSGKYHAESDGSRIVRQSLVLLEEVDILFKEDGGFWPAVVDFIRCCQRPVVMTCNDPGLVPIADLPLQKVLVFEPCPGPVAATFLQCVSLTEGCLVPHEDLMVLYERTDSKYGLDVPEGMVYPRAEPVVFPDLRRSITQLQMLCAGARHGSTSEKHQGDEASGHARRSGRPISAASRVTATGSRVESDWWRKMKRQSELMSHVDAELCRTTEGTGQVTRDEEEMGYVVLEEREGLVLWEHNELIAEEAIRHSRGVHEGCGTGPNEASISPAAGLDRARVEYQSRMVAALEDIVCPPGPLMPQGSVFLDYIPWVGHMVRVDDVLERRALEGRGGGRCTRNSARTVHARSVAVRDSQRELWRRSGLYLEDM